MPQTRQSTIGFNVRKSANMPISSKSMVKRNDCDENDTQMSASPTKITKYSNHDKQILNVKRVLSTSFVDKIIGRDSECKQLANMLSEKLSRTMSANVYIS